MRATRSKIRRIGSEVEYLEEGPFRFHQITVPRDKRICYARTDFGCLIFFIWTMMANIVLMMTGSCTLEALPVNDGGTRLIVLLLGDPHLLEGGQGSKDGASDPDRVFPLGRSNNLDFHGRWRQCGDLFLHTISNT